MAADYTSTGATEAHDGTDINSGDGANATVHEDPHSHGQCMNHVAMLVRSMPVIFNAHKIAAPKECLQHTHTHTHTHTHAHTHRLRFQVHGRSVGTMPPSLTIIITAVPRRLGEYRY